MLVMLADDSPETQKQTQLRTEFARLGGYRVQDSIRFLLQQNTRPGMVCRSGCSGFVKLTSRLLLPP